ERTEERRARLVSLFIAPPRPSRGPVQQGACPRSGPKSDALVSFRCSSRRRGLCEVRSDEVRQDVRLERALLRLQLPHAEVRHVREAADGEEAEPPNPPRDAPAL